MKRAAGWTLILVGTALTVGGAGLVFSESRAAPLAAGGGAIVVGLAVLAAGIVLKGRRRDRRARDWPLAPRS